MELFGTIHFYNHVVQFLEVEVENKKQHISAVSSSSCIVCFTVPYRLSRECSNICDKDMNEKDIAGEFNNSFERYYFDLIMI